MDNEIKLFEGNQIYSVVFNPKGFEENEEVYKRGGNLAKVARETLEKEIGQSVIIPKNTINFEKLIDDVTKEVSSQKIKDNKKEE